MTPLLVYAAPNEGEMLARAGLDVAPIGVGKVAATLGLSLLLADRKPEAVVAFGVCGAYPAEHGPGGRAVQVGDLCVVGSDVLADEGVQDEWGFRDLGAMGFGDRGPFAADAELVQALARQLGVPIVKGATVSTCSANDAASKAIATRCDAQVETMEGAAIGLVCGHFGVPWVQLRCVSNRTGDRSLAGWDLQRAVTRLHEAVVGLYA